MVVSIFNKVYIKLSDPKKPDKVVLKQIMSFSNYRDETFADAQMLIQAKDFKDICERKIRNWQSHCLASQRLDLKTYEIDELIQDVEHRMFDFYEKVKNKEPIITQNYKELSA